MTTRTTVSILDHMGTLAEGVRCRLLLLIEEHELTVSDLCAVLQLPQSTVSRHLKTLLDRGWVDSRPDGNRRLYRSTASEQDEAAVGLWALTRAELADTPAARADRQRLRSVLESQRSRSREFFDATGDRWDGLRDELFGGRFQLQAIAGLIRPDECIADLGCGTGALAEAIAPFAGEVVGVDTSAAMLEVAARRLERFGNVDLRLGELETLPIEDGTMDAVMMMLVLHHLEHPEGAIREAARCLVPGGTIVVVDMMPHERIDYRQEMGHVWLGFGEEVINGFLEDAGFGEARMCALPPAPEAKGPNLFVVSASKRREKR